MLPFRRRRTPQGVTGAQYAAGPEGAPAAVGTTTVRTAALPTGPGPGLTAGYRGSGVISADEQIGMFAGGPLTMVAGYVDEVQKRQGVESLSAGWFLPAQLTSSTGYAITMRAGNAAEVQRIVGGNNGGIGPITARQMRAQVTAAQIRQSGLAAIQWAQQLSPVSS